MDISGLPNSVASVLSLRIHCRVPVTVIEDDRVSTGQVNTDTATPRRQDETEYPLICIESLH